jgi:uncharacterized membrane protein YkvA (DUF1232 family)
MTNMGFGIMEIQRQSLSWSSRWSLLRSSISSRNGLEKKKTALIAFWKKKARELEVQTYALYYAYRDSRVPWYAKVLSGMVVAYAFSPIDLIPDFIPVLGYLDDLVIIPFGVWLVLKLIPVPVMEDCRRKAQEHLDQDPPQYKIMAVIIVLVWILLLGLAGLAAVHVWHK